MINRKWLPGYLLIALVTIISLFTSGLVVMGGKHPVDATIVAILLGMAIRACVKIPSVFESGIKASEKILIAGIVLLGVSLNLEELKDAGIFIIPVILGTMVAGYFSIYILGRVFKLSINLSILIALGTTICGGTAIAIAAPVIRARDEETGYAIGTISFWGLIGIIVYPLIAQITDTSDFNFGVFAGTAIHNTPQVVGAGYIFSEAAGTTATAVKLVRNCFIAPAVFFLALWYSARQKKAGETLVTGARIFPWFLFGYFIMAAFRSYGYFTPEGIEAFSSAGKICILAGMAGIGLNTHLSVFKSVGLMPLMIGGVGSAVVAGVSLILISILL